MPKMPHPQKVFCDRCGKECIPQGSTTGYGTNSTGQRHCFTCCGEVDKEEMHRSGRIMLYLTQTNKNTGIVKNWPGTLSFLCFLSKGKHNMARVRYDVQFVDDHGAKWYGVQFGDNTQICHCRRYKRQPKK